MPLVAALTVTIGGMCIMLHVLVAWLMSDQTEDEDAPRLKVLFLPAYNPRAWPIVKRWLAERPKRLTYRRDKRGRFRKLS